MKSFKLQKYKDENPLNTVNRVRNILYELGISPIEKWLNSVKGIYAVNIGVPGLVMATNGKGGSEEFALASAYGEFMERLQNQIIYKHYAFDPETQWYQDFCYAPDERYVSIEEVVADNSEWMQYLIPGQAPKEVRERVTRYLSFEAEDNCPGDFVVVPFYNVNDGQVYYLPITLLDIFCRSNGMCAGNTPQEALVQGIAEVMERYVNTEIVTKKIAPPTVPDEYLARFPQAYQMIKTIEQYGNYRIIIKDCSLGMGLPVVGMIFINMDQQKYFVKFGAHPAFDIALERTMTELFQGRDIGEIDQRLMDYLYINEMAHHPYNLDKILIDGTGCYPAEFFSNDFSYPFTPFKDVAGQSNKDMLKFLVELLVNKGKTVLIRDVSFLGFPAFRVIVPGMTEVNIFDEHFIETQSQILKVRKIVRNIKKASKKDLLKVVIYFEKLKLNNSMSLSKILALPLARESSLSQTVTDLFLSAAYYKLGQPRKAFESMHKFVTWAQGHHLTYYKCIRDYFGAVSEGLKGTEIQSRLGNIYSQELLKEVMSTLEDPEKVFQYYEETPCWNCASCTLNTQCNYEKIKQIHRTIKEKYKINCIEQKNIEQIIKF